MGRTRQRQLPPKHQQSQSPSDGKKEEKEPENEWLQLYYFPYQKDKTPLDFITDSETGKREGRKPTGWIGHDLRQGIGNTVLPPMAVWRKGLWLTDMSGDNQEYFKKLIPPVDREDAFLVSGEGTPGDYTVRIYLLHEDVSLMKHPDHPLLWKEKNKIGSGTNIYESSPGGVWSLHQRGGGSQANGGQPIGLGAKPLQPPRQSWYGGSGSSGFGYQAPQKQEETKPTKPKVASLPTSLRIRCVGCGHWWKMNDLQTHAEYCCPGLNDGLADWAVMCECCDTLDEVSTAKPGFPRPPQKEETKKQAPKTVKAKSESDDA